MLTFCFKVFSFSEANGSMSLTDSLRVFAREESCVLIISVGVYWTLLDMLRGIELSKEFSKVSVLNDTTLASWSILTESRLLEAAARSRLSISIGESLNWPSNVDSFTRKSSLTVS
ncbi:hypothetical protein OGATHE_006554 [Ogataea polymorpha]|uniref:Uncharacterized protein n=1 Tax=Ogataea polymorpha TaxID=460523 RepID=A0A9P8NRI6_9ASCO|nr:hypothetical protein OGATHE_006554 [Ogataea polymorpha]